MWHRLCRIRPFPRLISKREWLLYELPLISHEHWALSILSVYSPVNHFSRKTLFYLKLKLNFVRFCRKMVIFVKFFLRYKSRSEVAKSDFLVFVRVRLNFSIIREWHWREERSKMDFIVVPNFFSSFQLKTFFWEKLYYSDFRVEN